MVVIIILKLSEDLLNDCTEHIVGRKSFSVLIDRINKQLRNSFVGIFFVYIFKLCYALFDWKDVFFR